MDIEIQQDIRERVDGAWELFAQQRYREAFALWNLPVRHAPPRAQRGQGVECLLAGDWQGAVGNYLQARFAPPSPCPCEEIGIALWLSGLREAACRDWANEIARIRSRVITHMDSGGGVEVAAKLWWASAHHEQREWRQLADSELRRLRSDKDLRARGWPGPIGDFLLGDISEDMLLWAASSHDSPILQEKAHLQAWFYIGASYLSLGDWQSYIDCVERASMTHLPFPPKERFLAFWINRMHPSQLTLEFAE